MPQKRKRPDEPPEPVPLPQSQPRPPQQPQPRPANTQPPPARRATRNTPVQPPPIPPQYHYLAPSAPRPAQPAPAQLQPSPNIETEQRRTRSRPSTTPAVPSSPQLASLARAALQASSVPWTPPESHAQTTTRPPTQTAVRPPVPPTTTKATRHPAMASVAPPIRSAPVRTTPVAAPVRNAPVTAVRPPSNLVAPEITYHVPQAHSSSQRTSALVRPHGPSAPPPKLQAMTVTPVYPPKPPTISQYQTPAPAERVPPRPDRNIDKVVLGNICFRTWYPSYYGKEVLGDISGHSGKTGSKDTGGKDQTGGKAASRKERDHLPVLERLYVCPCCFKYSKELVAWWRHVRVCEGQAHVPGRKIYTHPQGRRKVLIPHDGKVPAPGAKKRRGEGGVKYIEEVIQDEGEWSIWEVDGEQDPLFCQNLSLFAKLFLDNKSVFFDVSGFNYFLLVYTPPPPKAPGNGDVLRPHITGFFSKEKMSWDNNNLACILVFPPWQRKGLGALLMGASYEISRREGILGGPEKPISDLGKKGYKRFWAGEIARWLLGLDLNANDGKEVLVDVNDCSQATWIHPDDCLLVLRDMGIVEEAGMGPGKPPKVEKESHGEEPATASSSAAAVEKVEGGEQHPAVEEAADKEVKMVLRVRVDKQALRRYVSEHRILLERTCDADGFVEGYAMKALESKEEAEDEENQEE
ncbi:acyl-CoA N-acyltransferase [Thelonectria olida]|uniref:histone acetyltransferase n=1 Tax=Thelonectria olida TaxID=1576542 RepID=A0A9P8W7G0_9HYPO|nr:acyl-CoA N-acyltransferase [Thelonectria olida]